MPFHSNVKQIGGMWADCEAIVGRSYQSDHPGCILREVHQAFPQDMTTASYSFVRRHLRRGKENDAADAGERTGLQERFSSGNAKTSSIKIAWKYRKST
jgi:hypothetical protein